MEIIYCELCGIPTDPDSLVYHYSGQKHDLSLELICSDCSDKKFDEE